jgi:hypothetical protein
MRAIDNVRRRVLVALGVSVALMAIAVTPASAAVHFGADLSSLPFPSNAYPGSYCDHLLNGGNATYGCTWIEDYAYNNGGLAGAKAPMNGTIGKIKLIAGQGGSFRLFIARYKPGTHQGKVIRKGPTITYATDPCNVDCHVQTFNIAALTVKTGDFLAFKAAKSSFLRCDSGGNRVALFKPPLVVGDPLKTETGNDGCYVLLQAVYN